MGNLINFLREVDSSPRALPPAIGVCSEPLSSRQTAQPKPAPWTFPVVFRHLARFARGGTASVPHVHPDAYTLVLLADQELTAGRDNQAETLLNAAYSAFDRQVATGSGAAA
jgi:hypothetical protein